MKKTLWILLVLIVLAGWFVGDLLVDAGHFKNIEPIAPGPCELVRGVVGAEDITIHPRTGMAYISSSDRRTLLAGGETRGGIYGYDLKTDDARPVELSSTFSGELNPHGISLYLDSGGEDRLFVVNHTTAGHSIEIFSVTSRGLAHLESVTDPLIYSPNDVHATGPRSFYATNDHGFSGQLSKTIEEYARLSRANVVACDAQGCRLAADGIAYANGINQSLDGTRIFVASSTGGRIHVYERDPKSGELTETTPILYRTGHDNIELDADGNLWVGAHAKLLAFAAHARSKKNLSPSHVFKVLDPTSNSPQIVDVYLNDGTPLSGSSAAAVYGEKLLVGSVFEDGFLVCSM